MRVYRARVFTPIADPFVNAADSYRYYEDGYIAIDKGRIAGVGQWSADAPAGAEIIELGPNALITPGFFDTHLHAPQLEMIGPVRSRA